MAALTFPLFLSEASSVLAAAATKMERARAARGVLAHFISQPEFVLDCFAATLDALPAVGYQSTVYEGRLAETRVMIRIFSWPSGYANAPHGHTTWTVTGVLYGKLRFVTYELRSGQELRRLHHCDGGAGHVEIDPLKHFDSDEGQVGFIGDDCIHNGENAWRAPALSLHVFSLNERPDQGSETILFESSTPPRKFNRREHMLCSLAHALETCRYDPTRSRVLLERMFELGRIDAKLAAIRALARFDQKAAALLFAAAMATHPEALRARLDAMRAKGASASSGW